MGVCLSFLLPSIIYPITIITTVVFCLWMVYAASCVYKCVDDSARLQSNAASSLIHELLGTIDGIETIRAYKKEEMFLTR